MAAFILDEISQNTCIINSWGLRKQLGAYKHRGKGMKKTIIRAVSAVLILLLAASVMSCGRSGKTRKIKSDTPWYDTGVVKAELGIDTSRSIFSDDSHLAGSDDKSLIVVSSGSYYRAGDNLTIQDYDDDSFAYVAVIDKETGLTVKTIDLSEEFTFADRILRSSYKDGIVTLHIDSTDQSNGKSSFIHKDVDISTGKIKDSTDYSGKFLNVAQRSFGLGDYIVNYDVIYEDPCIALAVYSPDGNAKRIELKETGKEFYGVNAVIPAGDNKALVIADSNPGVSFFEIDLENGNSKALDPKDYEWIDADGLKKANSINGETYYTTSLGLFRLDLDKKTAEQVIDFSYCSVNRTLLEDLYPADISGDTYILTGRHQKLIHYGLDGENGGFYIVKFNKAAKNPHAGKTILDLYIPDGNITDTVNDAVLKFNETNKDCFIEITDKYRTADAGNELYAGNSNDEVRDIELNENMEMSTRLAMDIINGEGPDIIMNSSMLGQLNSSSYLADLSPYFNDLDPDKYFTNIMEGAKVDGKLYHMPVCFRIEGICTDRANAGASGVGFTTEEYEKFLYDVLNGKDIIYSGQAHYFAAIFDSMKDKFIKEGKADFTGPEFAALAEFVKNNVREKALSYDNEDYGINSEIAQYGSYRGMIDYFSRLSQIKGDMSILGLPSSDGRGPMFRSYISAAVSAQSENVEASVEFIKILLSDETQEALALQENYVLNKAALRKAGMAAADHFNDPFYDGIYVPIPNGPSQQKRYIFSKKNIDDLEDIILSCSGMHSEDQAVSIILIEEMPAYFTGQKSLDDVIKIAQDRAQKVLDERK